MQNCNKLFLLILFAISFTQVRGSAVDFDTIPEKRWPTDRPIPYYIDPRLSYSFSQTTIKVYMLVFTHTTCLKFVEITADNEAKFINDTGLLFVPSSSCYTSVGKSAGLYWHGMNWHVIQINDDCPANSGIGHQILHALGLHDTHQRYDRDDFITLDLSSNATETDELHAMKSLENETSTFGVPFDFSSIMNSRSKSHSGVHITAKNPLFQVALESKILTPAHSDYLLLNRAYGCLDRCVDVETLCENGGFVNPNDCTRCICPAGFAGAFCSSVKREPYGDSYCGGIVYATDEWQMMRRSIVIKSHFPEIKCYWHLKTSSDKQLEIVLLHVNPNVWNGFFELKLGNFEIGGFKFITDQHVPQRTFRTDGNLALLTLVADESEKEFELEFRSVLKEPVPFELKSAQKRISALNSVALLFSAALHLYV